ncbi:hypothetical protein [Pontibacter ummariensis]|nr:hypothetical protein [Pontibacter ummariensis]
METLTETPSTYAQSSTDPEACWESRPDDWHGTKNHSRHSLDR